jgi:hypothetical protein
MQSLGGSSPAVVGGTEGFTTGGVITPAQAQAGGRKRRGASVKTLKKMLKKAGLKTSGKKAALTRRAKKAHLKMRGGEDAEQTPQEEGRVCFTDRNEAGTIENGNCVASDMGGRRRSRRRNGLVKGVYRGVTGVAKGTLRSVGKVGKAVFGRGRKGKKY